MTRILQNTPKRWQLPPLEEGDHKYRRGHVLVLGGATMTGAAKLAALAAQRAGAGVVTLASPPVAWPVYAASMMSVITRRLDKPGEWAWTVKHRKVTAILLGPGNEALEVRAALPAALKSGLPLVLDAGALELLAHAPAFRRRLKHVPFAVLPHEGEYKKLAEALGLDSGAKKPDRAKAMAQALGGVVLLKGAETYIAAPDGRVVCNHQHAPWLAVAGSGDVLAGVVTALAGQGMDLFDACCAAAWLHGKAAEGFGRGMIPEDLLAALPTVFKNLE